MPLSPLAASKVDAWNRMIDVNIRGVLHGLAATLWMLRWRMRASERDFDSYRGELPLESRYRPFP